MGKPSSWGRHKASHRTRRTPANRSNAHCCRKSRAARRSRAHRCDRCIARHRTVWRPHHQSRDGISCFHLRTISEPAVDTRSPRPNSRYIVAIVVLTKGSCAFFATVWAWTCNPIRQATRKSVSPQAAAAQADCIAGDRPLTPAFDLERRYPDGICSGGIYRAAVFVGTALAIGRSGSRFPQPLSHHAVSSRDRCFADASLDHATYCRGDASIWSGWIAEVLAFSLNEISAILPLHFFIFPRTIALFLLGAFVWRTGILHEIDAHTRLLGVLAAILLPVGLGLSALHEGLTPFNRSSLGVLWFMIERSAPVILALGYAATVLALIAAGGWRLFAGQRLWGGWHSPTICSSR